jgi:hypothetical protein
LSIVDRLTPSSRAVEATLLPGAAAQVASMITASRAGNPLGGAGPARTVAGEAMAEMWLGVLLILGIDLVLVGLVCAIVFVATTGLGRWQDRRQARRFAEAAAGGDFEEAETIVRAASHQAGRTDLVV